MRSQEMVRRFGGAHAGVNEADQVAEIVIAENHVHLMVALLP